jgi:thymidylate synthase
MLDFHRKRNYIIDENLSYAWGKALLLLHEEGIKEIHPLFVTIKNIKNNTPAEDTEIRDRLDRLLAKHNKYSCNTVANTIFPASLWNPDKDRKLLYERYRRICSKIKDYDAIGSRHGRYFSRFIDYGSGEQKINQLEYLISTRKDKGNNRRSALQASVIDPYIDHTNEHRRGFPCLQQVCFAPLEEDKLSVTGFYPYQYIVERAYGNYLGLCRLGHFIAHELGLELSEMNCVTGIAKLGDINKSDSDLLDLRDFINQNMK